jgi:hypothetical protein
MQTLSNQSEPLAISRVFPLELVPSSILLLRLTAIHSPPILFLVPRHARTKCYVHSRGRGKAKALGNLHEVEFVHVEDTAEAVRRVGLQVTAVRVFCRLYLSISARSHKQPGCHLPCSNSSFAR